MPWDLIGRLLSIYPKHTGPLLSACQRVRFTLCPPCRFLFDKVHGKASLLPPAAEEDGDVQAERNRVESGKADFDVVQLQNLTKVYHLPHKRIVAVKNISLGIPAGEVSEGKGCRHLLPWAGKLEQIHSPPVIFSPSACHCPSTTAMVCSALTPSFALFVDCWGYGSDERLLVDLGHQVTV